MRGRRERRIWVNMLPKSREMEMEMDWKQGEYSRRCRGLRQIRERERLAE